MAPGSALPLPRPRAAEASPGGTIPPVRRRRPPAGRLCGRFRRATSGAAAAAAVSIAAAAAVLLACLAVAARGSPPPATAADGGGWDQGASSATTPTSWTVRASNFVASGPCSTSTCLAWWKAGFITALFVEGVVGGVAPQALRLLRSPERALHVANAFSGGVFFSTGMLHLLPEAVEYFSGHDVHGVHEEHGEHEEGEHDHEGEEEGAHEGEEEPHEGEEEGGHAFPTAYALAVGAFYAILIVEHLILGKYAHSHGHAATVAHDTAMAKGVPCPPPMGCATHVGGGDVPLVGCGEGDGGGAPRDAIVASDELEEDPAAGANGTGTGTAAAAAAGGLVHRSSSSRSFASSVGAHSHASSHGHMLAAENVGFLSPNFMRAALAAVSVAIHSAFESLALGLASSWTTALHTFIAIAAHKWATASSLGIKYEKERLRRLQLAVLILGWAAVTPVAAGVGAALQGGVGDTALGVLFGISAGIFIYIGAFEVTAEEFVEHTRDRWAKAATAVLGAAIIMAITGVLGRTGVH